MSEDWIPVAKRMPPPGQKVEVLYTDGVSMQCEAAGKMFIGDGGYYRYVEATFWRPLTPPAAAPAGPPS